MIKSFYKKHIKGKKADRDDPPRKSKVDPVKLPIKVFEKTTIKKLGYNQTALDLTVYALQYYHSGHKICFNPEFLAVRDGSIQYSDSFTLVDLFRKQTKIEHHYFPSASNWFAVNEAKDLLVCREYFMPGNLKVRCPILTMFVYHLYYCRLSTCWKSR